MTHATKTAKALLDEVTGALGLFAPPTREFFRDTLNECLCRLYTDVIREAVSVSHTVEGGRIPLASLSSPSTVAVRGEDILSVYADGDCARYLLPCDFMIAGGLKTPYYTVDGEDILLNRESCEARVLFLLRPMLCTAENEEEYEIPLPPEFLPLLSARLCGEGYKAANEDELAAKWLGDYNGRLSDFAAYLRLSRAAKEGR